MFTQYTSQDFDGIAEKDLPRFVLDCVEKYKHSADFERALEALDYFTGHNRRIGQKYLLHADVQVEKDERGRTKRRVRPVRVRGNQLPSGFFRRAVMQLSGYLLSNGVFLGSREKKMCLGADFDRMLEMMGQMSLIEGVCWGFFNLDHLEVIPAAQDALSGFVPLYDEETGRLGAGIQFWQLDETRPLRVRLFEREGVTGFSFSGEKCLYRGQRQSYVVGLEGLSAREYDRVPVVPLYANNEHESELTPAIKEKIDAYDNILSDLGNNLDRANDVYWVLNNFGGEMQQALEVQEQINRLKMVLCRSDLGQTSTAEMHTVEVPYEARQAALNILRKELYADFMALDMTAVTGGSLTNVAIRAAMADLDLKCNAFEWQCCAFVREVLLLAGTSADQIVFKRQTISNAHETVQDIYLMRGDIDRRTALELNPYIDPDLCVGEETWAEKQEGKSEGGQETP